MKNEYIQEDYVLYSPLSKFSGKGTEYWEVWRGLPCEPKPAKTRGGETTLCLKERGMYVWLFPDAARGYAENPATIFMALGRRNQQIGLSFVVKMPFATNTGEIIARAKKLNADIWHKDQQDKIKYRRHQKKQTRKGK